MDWIRYIVFDYISNSEKQKQKPIELISFENLFFKPIDRIRARVSNQMEIQQGHETN